jgi:hypothetical protein
MKSNRDKIGTAINRLSISCCKKPAEYDREGWVEHQAAPEQPAHCAGRQFRGIAGPAGFTFNHENSQLTSVPPSLRISPRLRQAASHLPRRCLDPNTKLLYEVTTCSGCTVKNRVGHLRGEFYVRSTIKEDASSWNYAPNQQRFFDPTRTGLRTNSASRTSAHSSPDESTCGFKFH